MGEEIELLRSLVEQSPDHAIFLIDPKGYNLTWGVGVERLLGYTAEEFIGRHTSEIFVPEDREAGVPERELAFAAEHGTASDERWLARKDGTRFWASGITYGVKDAEGRLAGFGKIFRDLTVEREFEQTLRGSAERYRLAARAADEALWDRDLNTDTMVWTDGFEEVFGYLPSEVDRDISWWEERIHPEDRPRALESMRRAIDTGHERWEEEYRFRRRDGEYALVHDRALIMRSATGIPLRMLGAMVDLGRLERGREELRQARRLEIVGRLAGGVAHELNNMLMSIIGYADILDRDLSPADPRRRDVAEILASARRSAALTRRLLAFARREITRPVRLRVDGAIARLAPALRSLPASRIELELDLAAGSAQVEADPGQLEQILLDLVRNAEAAMPDGGRLTIETREQRFEERELRRRHPGAAVRAGRYVTIAVIDSGSGMSPEVLEHAFEPFFTTRPLGQGAGLGLAAVYGMVKQNAGYVWASSEPGRGSRFEIMLPAAPQRDNEEAAAVAEGLD